MVIGESGEWGVQCAAMAQEATAQRRAACHQRVWRLAWLLAGEERAARRVFRRVLSRRPDLHKLEPAFQLRMTIMAGREVLGDGEDGADGDEDERGYQGKGGQGAAEDGRAAAGGASGEADEAGGPTAGEMIAAVHRMPRQVIEAWMLRYMEGLDDVTLSRAMDCSRTAARRYLAHGEERMRAKFWDRLGPGVERLQEAARALDPAPAARQWQASRRRRWLWRLVLLVAVIVLLLWLAGDVIWQMVGAVLQEM